jgi:hypothetical protein
MAAARNGGFARLGLWLPGFARLGDEQRVEILPPDAQAAFAEANGWQPARVDQFADEAVAAAQDDCDFVDFQKLWRCCCFGHLAATIKR